MHVEVAMVPLLFLLCYCEYICDKMRRFSSGFGPRKTRLGQVKEKCSEQILQTTEPQGSKEQFQILKIVVISAGW